MYENHLDEEIDHKYDDEDYLNPYLQSVHNGFSITEIQNCFLKTNRQINQ